MTVSGNLAPFERERTSIDALGWVERAIALAGLLVLMGAFRGLLLSEGAERTSGSALFQLVSGGVYLSGIIVLLVRRVPAWAIRVLLHAWPLLLLTLLPLLSTLWSQAPEATLRRAITLLLSSTFAVFVLVRFNLRTAFNLIALSFGVFVVVGILAAGVPGLGITPGGPYAGAWRGLTGQKNVFGRTVALAVALLPLAAMTGLLARRGLIALTTFLAFGLLILSRSATSLFAAVISVPLGLLLYIGLGGRIGRARLRPELGITLLVIAAIAGTLAFTYGRTAVLEALGRDPTLTGRTELWNWATAANEDRRWLGSGFRAFWIDANTIYYSEFFWVEGFEEGEKSDTSRGPDHAHSGYVDQYLELGVVGVVLLGVTIFAALLSLRSMLAGNNVPLGIIFPTIIAFLLVYSTSERAFLQYSEDLWFLFSLFYLFSVKETLYPGDEVS
jgi:exopolysaccharide production protein ExoQ